MDIDTMQAGRELDALVAEKVMGYLWWHRDGDNLLLEPQSVAWQESLHLEPGKIDAPQDICLGMDNYSTDIAAAWLVVEKLHMTVHTPGASFACGEYKNYRDYAAETQDGELTSAATAPLAICRAALKAQDRPADVQ